MWLQPGVINAPALTTEFAIAEERKPASLCRKPQAKGMYNKPSGIQMHKLPKLQQTQSE
jgi:hypothetical protein